MAIATSTMQACTNSSIGSNSDALALFRDFFKLVPTSSNSARKASCLAAILPRTTPAPCRMATAWSSVNSTQQLPRTAAITAARALLDIPAEVAQPSEVGLAVCHVVYEVDLLVDA